MAQRKPLDILLVGVSREIVKNNLAASIKKTDPTANIKIINNAKEALKALHDNQQNFDAVYVTFDRDNETSFFATNEFVNAANVSLRKKNGIIALAGISNPRSEDNLLVSKADVEEKRKELKLEFAYHLNPMLVADDYHRDLIAASRQQQISRAQAEEILNQNIESLQLIEDALIEKINALYESRGYFLKSSSEQTFTGLFQKFETAKDAFKPNMSNEEIGLFGVAYADFINAYLSVDSENFKLTNSMMMPFAAAAGLMVGAVFTLLAFTWPAALVVAGIVAAVAIVAACVGTAGIVSLKKEADVIETVKHANTILRYSDSLSLFAHAPVNEPAEVAAQQRLVLA